MDLGKFEKIVRNARNLSSGEEPRTSHPFLDRNIHQSFPPKVKKLFDDGHCAEATFEACKFFDRKIAAASGLSGTGFKLMMNAFNETNPPIKATLLSGESGENEQVGAKFIAAGIMSAMRNPKGHEYDLMDTPDVCLDQLSVLSALMRQIEAAHGDIF